MKAMQAAPIAAYVNRIVEAVRGAQVIIVTGPPGLGKTTAVPAMILADRIARADKQIVCSLPTRAAAITAAQYVSDQYGQPVGKIVGYHVRNDEKSTKGRTKILYTTDGTLVQRTMIDPQLRFCDVVVVDEAHLRTYYTDTLLAYLKSLLKVRPELRLVVSSATMQVDVFRGFFPDARLVEIELPSYPVEIFYRTPTRARTTELVFNEIRSLHAGGNTGSTLVFLPGVRDIRELEIKLRRSRLTDIEVFPLHGSLHQEEQQKVFESSKVRHRVILATNLAETSVTLPGVTVVIDTGTAWEEEYYPSKEYRRVRLRPISQASAKQRAGRAGRLGPGKCIRLYTEADYASRPSYSTPEFSTMDATAAVMRFMVYGVRSFETLDLLTPFSAEQVECSRKLLIEWGAVTKDGEMTPLGKNMAQLPLAPQLARMVLLACAAGAGLEAIEVAALLSVRQANARDGGVDLSMEGRHAQYYDSRGDAFTLLAVKREYLMHRHDQTWCQAQGVNMQMLESAHAIREQVVRRLGGLGVTVSYGADLDFIHRVFVRAWGGKLCVQHQRRVYRHGEMTQIFLDPNLGFVPNPPTMVVAFELLRVGRFYAIHPLTVPEDMHEEVSALYGNPWKVSVPKGAPSPVRLQGALMVQHLGVSRVVRVDIDATRSATRSLTLLRNRTVLLETESFLVEWLRISPEIAAALQEQGITTLAEIPKMPHLLRQLSLNEDAVRVIERALYEVGQYPVVPQPTTTSGRKVEAPLAQEEVKSDDVEDDWLVESLKGRPIESLELSRALRMRLYGAGVATISDFLAMTREAFRVVCDKQEVLIQEGHDVLAEYGWSLQTVVEKNATVRMGLAPLPVEALPVVTAEQARMTLGDADFRRFMDFRSSERSVRLRARNELLVEHEGLRLKAASKLDGFIKRARDNAIDQQDAVQEAVLGAMVSIVKFDPFSGFRYSTYATRWISQAITRMVYDQGVIRLPVHRQEGLGRFTRACRKLEVKYGKMALTIDFIANELGMEPEDVAVMQELLLERQFQSIDAPVVSEGGEDDVTVADYVADLRDNPEQIMWRQDQETKLREVVKDVLGDLPIPLRTRRMFAARYGLDGEGGKTLEEIGSMFDITRERVRQLLEPVLEQLRTPEVWDRFKAVLSWMGKRPKVQLTEEQINVLSTPVHESELSRAMRFAGCTGEDERIFLLYLGIGMDEPQSVSEIAAQLGMEAAVVQARKESVVSRISHFSSELWSKLRYQRRAWLRALAETQDEEESL